MKSIRVPVTTPQGFKRTFSGYPQPHINHTLGFWYAMNRINKQVRKVYVGRDKNMTIRRLVEVTPKVCQPG
jgi:hypothetical protein